MIPASPPPPNRVLLERILASPDLARAGEREGRLQALLEHLWKLLGDWLGASGAGEVSRVVVLVVIVALTAFLLAWVLRRLRPHLPTRSSAPGAPIRLAAPERHLADAEAARADGRLRAAMRHELLATLALLERARLVGYGRHKTNREYLGELGRRSAPPAVARAFEAYVVEYDARFYGLAEIDGPHLDRLSHARRAVFQAAERPS